MAESELKKALLKYFSDQITARITIAIHRERESNQQMCGQLKSETIQCQRHARHCPPCNDDGGSVKFTLHYVVPKCDEMGQGNKAAVYLMAAF